MSRRVAKGRCVVNERQRLSHNSKGIPGDYRVSAVTYTCTRLLHSRCKGGGNCIMSNGLAAGNGRVTPIGCLKHSRYNCGGQTPRLFASHFESFAWLSTCIPLTGRCMLLVFALQP